MRFSVTHLAASRYHLLEFFATFVAILANLREPEKRLRATHSCVLRPKRQFIRQKLKLCSNHVAKSDALLREFALFLLQLCLNLSEILRKPCGAFARHFFATSRDLYCNFAFLRPYATLNATLQDPCCGIARCMVRFFATYFATLRHPCLEKSSNFF